MEKDEKPIIIFDDSIVPQILDIFDKEINVETKQIVDTKFKEPLIDRFSEKIITESDFGGVLPGSRIFISKDKNSIAEYISEFC